MASAAEKLLRDLDKVTSSVFENNHNIRQQLAMAAHKLFYNLENKEEKIFRLAIEEPILFSVLQATINMGLWEGWRWGERRWEACKDLPRGCRPGAAA